MSNGNILTAGQAAKRVGVSKPTISRAISEGRLSANRREDGSFGIDVSELLRWKEAYRHRHGTPEHSATHDETPETATVLIAKARLEAELAGARALLEAERQRAETAERDRDRWHAAFLALPNGVARPESGWRSWLSGGKASRG